MHTNRLLNFAASNGAHRKLRVATVAVFLLCGVLGLAVMLDWNHSGRLEATISTVTVDAGGDHESPVRTPGTRRPTGISTSSVNSLAEDLAPDSVRYYADQTGAAFSANLRSGTVSTLSDRPLAGFIRSVWVSGKRQVISLFESKGARELRFYDYDTAAVVPLGEGATSFAVSPDTRSLAYITGASEAPEVRVVGTDGTGDRRILNTRVTLAQVSWPQSNTIAVTSRRHDRTGTDMSLITLDGSFRRLLEDLENLEYRWSPDGRRLLFSYFVPAEGIRLWYRDLESPLDIALGVETSAQKCAWHPGGTRVTCGVPTKTELARDIPSDMMATSDDIVTIDLETLTQTQLASADQKTPLGVMEPVVTESAGYFAFVNLFDHRLYSLPLR